MRIMPLDSALSQAWTVMSEVWTFITGNTLLNILVVTAVGIALVGGVLSLFLKK